MRLVPDWVRGTGFKKLARQCGTELIDVVEKPYAFVKHQMAQGKNEASFLSRLLEAGDSDPEVEFTSKWSAVTLYAAGAETVSSPTHHLT